MNRWLRRLAVGLLFASPLVFLSYALARASTRVEVYGPQAQDLACQACHPAFQRAWEGGAHGQATSDPAFREAWRMQGSPEECLTCHTTGYDPSSGASKGDGVVCEACHNPIVENHPQEPMATDRSATSCGGCHTETFFEWQVSKHRQVDLACIGCHDPHATGLKVSDPSELCATCHRLRASSFAHSQHSQVGLTCADCHLGPLNGEVGEGHATRDHSFDVRLSTCNACHAYQMHDPVEVHPDRATPTPLDPMASVETLVVSAEPSPVSPVGFAALSGLIGMASGMILAPWLERWYRRVRQGDLGD